MTTEVWRVNAFTTTPFTGNPAGVVHEADGLSDELMQKIARELNDVSETVFISTATDPSADIKLRYFTSATEVDLCGHATIAALFTLAWVGKLAGMNGHQTLVAETTVGLLTLGITFVNGKLKWATMEQLKPQHAIPTRPQLAAQVLGLPDEAISTELSIGCCSTGIWACFVPLVSQDALANIHIQRNLIEQLWPENETLTGIYAFTVLKESTDEVHHTQGRFFSPPKYGIVEDPVTGTASGALGGYLIEQRRLRPNGVLFAKQGVEMGRAGLVQVQQNHSGRMMISGQAVPVFKGHIVSGY